MNRTVRVNDDRNWTEFEPAERLIPRILLDYGLEPWTCGVKGRTFLNKCYKLENVISKFTLHLLLGVV